MGTRMGEIVGGIGPTNVAPVTPYEAVIDNTVTAVGQDLFITIPSLDQGRTTKGPLRWTPMPGPSGTLIFPSKGDLAQVIRTNEGYYWLNAFIPTAYPADPLIASRVDALESNTMRKIANATLVLGGALQFASIPQTFKHLRVYFIGQSNRAGFTNTGFRFRVNGLTTSVYYAQYWARDQNLAANSMTTGPISAASFGYLGQAPAGSRSSDSKVLSGTLDLPYYAVSGIEHMMNSESTYNDGVASTGGASVRNFVLDTNPITQIDLLDDVGSALGPKAQATLYGMM